MLYSRGKALSELTAGICNDISGISAAAWNGCADAGDEYNPFLDHRFLHALEASGSASPKTGWQPFHLVLQDGDRLLGVAPMYLKSHSRGEYVFDGGWAEAWYRAGGEYYPKLQASIPFTPATGPRLLSASGERAARVEEQLLAASVQIADRIGVSSLHYTFMPRAQWERAAKLGLLQRVDTQYHWSNAGFDTFDQFLSHLASKKRKNIRRERREAIQDGIEVEWVTGSDLTERHWDCFHDFYMDTANRKWGTPYLNRRFFSLVSESMPERTLLIMARRRGRYIAGALNFIGSHALFGRNWGCLEDHRFLHFELCYYQAIDFAIAHGLQRVEAGAQGPHKVARGYLPRETYSVHWIRDAGLRKAVARYLVQEKHYVRQDAEWTAARAPFRKDIDLSRYVARWKENQTPTE